MEEVVGLLPRLSRWRLELAHRLVALLRGVNNIGFAKRVAMRDLRALVEGLGFRDVRTMLNSGNIVFSASNTRRGEVAARIEKALASRLGVNPRVSVLTGNEVTTAVRGNPFVGVAFNPSRVLVVVPRASSDHCLLNPLLKKRWGREVLALGKRVAYLWCANGVGKSKLWREVDRALGQSGTARNIATMMRLLALVEGLPK